MNDPGADWDRRFTEHQWPTDPDPLLVELAGPLPPGRALDLASGPGRNSLWLASLGWEVTAVDASAVALEQAQRRAEQAGNSLSVVQADVTRWQPPAAASELVVVANLHPPGETLAQVLEAAAAALVAGGHLFVVGHDLANLGRHGPPDADRLLTVERLEAALPASITAERLTRYTRRRDDQTHGDDTEDIAVLGWGVKASPDAG